MGVHPSDQAKPKRRWFQFSLRTMLLAVAAFAILLGLLVYFRPHLWWRFGPPSSMFHDVQRVPTGPMPAARTPDGWVRCRLASLEFDLPRGLAEGFRTRGRVALLKHGTRSVHLPLPTSTDELLEFLNKSTAGLPELRQLSPARLHLAAHEASWDDFRWTMSRKELASHMFLVTFRSLVRLAKTRKVETLLRDDVEGLLVVAERYASFGWWSTDGRAWGYMNFTQKSGEIDLSWVRPVCHSFRYSGQSFPDKMTHDELTEAFEILEP